MERPIRGRGRKELLLGSQEGAREKETPLAREEGHCREYKGTSHQVCGGFLQDNRIAWESEGKPKTEPRAPSSFFAVPDPLLGRFQ